MVEETRRNLQNTKFIQNEKEGCHFLVVKKMLYVCGRGRVPCTSNYVIKRFTVTLILLFRGSLEKLLLPTRLSIIHKEVYSKIFLYSFIYVSF